jgi:hypothetical protein
VREYSTVGKVSHALELSGQPSDPLYGGKIGFNAELPGSFPIESPVGIKTQYQSPVSLTVPACVSVVHSSNQHWQARLESLNL